MDEKDEKHARMANLKSRLDSLLHGACGFRLSFVRCFLLLRRHTLSMISQLPLRKLPGCGSSTCAKIKVELG